MKAIVRTGYGSPDVLQLKEVKKPVPNDDGVLVEIHAASVNPADYYRMRGGLVRVIAFLLRIPPSPIPGTDVSGRVEAIGKNVTEFKPGDEVFGTCSGGFAEYASAREDRLVLKPANISFEEAAAVPIAAVTALQGLRNKGHIRSGQKVLVNGASGGVGTFAVQIAKSFGAEVTGVCSTRNLDQARSIGADHVIDYMREDFTRCGECYDLICDVVGNHSVSQYKRALRPQGICVLVGFSSLPRMFTHMVTGPLMSVTGNKKVGLMGIARVNKEDLAFMRELLEGGRVVPVIDRRYPLSETADAVRYLAEGHARGKVIVTVNHDGCTQEQSDSTQR